jgi:hypothetical protein
VTPERAAAPRAVLLGVCAAVLGVAVHGEAGGAVGPAPPTPAVAVLVVLVTALLGARPGSPARTVAVLAAGQLALHLSLSPDDGLHAHHAPPAAHGPGMVLAHLAVAAVVGGALVRADRALARTAREHWTTLRRSWRALLTDVPVTPAPAPLLARAVPAAPGPAARAAVGHHPRRGPPSAR